MKQDNTCRRCKGLGYIPGPKPIEESSGLDWMRYYSGPICPSCHGNGRVDFLSELCIDGWAGYIRMKDR